MNLEDSKIKDALANFVNAQNRGRVGFVASWARDVPSCISWTGDEVSRVSANYAFGSLLDELTDDEYSRLILNWASTDVSLRRFTGRKCLCMSFHGNSVIAFVSTNDNVLHPEIPNFKAFKYVPKSWLLAGGAEDGRFVTAREINPSAAKLLHDEVGAVHQIGHGIMACLQLLRMNEGNQLYLEAAGAESYATSTLNRARRKRGQEPIPSPRVIYVSPEVRQTVVWRQTVSHNDSGSSRSPHDRIAHIRRYKSGLIVNVRAAKIHGGSTTMGPNNYDVRLRREH